MTSRITGANWDVYGGVMAGATDVYPSTLLHEHGWHGPDCVGSATIERKHGKGPIMKGRGIEMRWVAALCAAFLTACGGDDSPTTPAPSTTPETIALVSVAANSSTLTELPTSVVATFNAKVSALGTGFFKRSGTCGTLPTATPAVDASGKIVTVTLAGSRCSDGQTVTLTLDPNMVTFDSAVGQKGAIWTRTYTISGTARSVGGTVTGLTGTVVLQNNGGDTLSTSTDGTFNFPTLVAQGGAYAVTVATQPAGQTCSVSHGTGTVGTTAVQDVAVVCAANTHTVGGTASGLVGTVTVQNNGGDTLAITGNGPFTFPTAIAEGGAYAVTVQSQPASQTCTVGNGTGSMGSAAVQNVSITCATNTYTVGGTVSGLSGQLQLQLNGADTQTVTGNGPFTFATPVAEGGPYNVTVLTQPAIQTCMVINGSGTLPAQNVTTVGVSCITNTTTLSVAATGVIPVSGGTGTIVVTNIGSIAATNVAAQLPSAWSGVTQDASNCAVLTPGASCMLQFTSATPYVAQGGIAIAADNVGSPNPTTALAFSVGGDLVFAVTSASTAKVVALTDAGLDVWGGMGTAIGVAAQSLTDGAGNTSAIVASLGTALTYAANFCNASTSGGAPAGTWYLPAACEIGSAGGLANCPAGIANIEDNLMRLGFGNLAGPYWTSTEYASTPANVAWLMDYSSNPATSIGGAKTIQLNARCARSVNY